MNNEHDELRTNINLDWQLWSPDEEDVVSEPQQDDAEMRKYLHDNGVLLIDNGTAPRIVKPNERARRGN